MSMHPPNRRPFHLPSYNSSRRSRGDTSNSTPSTRPPGATPPSSSELLFAGRYQIVKELARGGMGVVWQAWDTKLPRDVAIKIPLHLHDPESHRRFWKVAQAAAKLDHPNICRILDLGEADGLPFIVLGFVCGRTLAQLVAKQPVGPVVAAKIIRSLARTLHFAHEHGVSHRDLKPANLMIGSRRELIVMDFGLARFEGEERVTRTGQCLGTLPYMAPEQVQGRAGEMGKCCDIYALGMIFYELLTGRLPFLGPNWELPRQIINVEPEPPSSFRTGLDPELDAIVLQAMFKSIPGRFRSMKEFGSAVEEYLRKRGSESSIIRLPGVSAIPVKQEPFPVLPGKEALFPVRIQEERLRPAKVTQSPRTLELAWCLAGLLTLAAVSGWVAKDRSRGNRVAEPEPIEVEKKTTPPEPRRATLAEKNAIAEPVIVETEPIIEPIEPPPARPPFRPRIPVKFPAPPRGPGMRCR